MRTKHVGPLIAGLLLVACSSDSDPTGPQPTGTELTVQGSTCTTGAQVGGRPYLVCGNTTYVSVDPSGIQVSSSGPEFQALQSAVTSWHNAVLEPAPYNMPNLVAQYSPPSGNPRVIKVKFDAVGLSEWCGSGANAQISIGPPNGFCAPTSNLKALIMHELGDESFGIAIPTSAAPSVEEECASFNFAASTSPCVHEIQELYRLAGLRGSVSWTSEMWTGVSISGPGSIDEDSSASYTANFTRTGGSGGGGGGGGGSPPIPIVAGQSVLNSGIEPVDANRMSVVNPAFQWSHNGGLGLSCTTCTPVTVTGLQPGPRTLEIELGSGSNVEWPEPSATRNITVNEAEPPPPPPVASIVVTPSSVFVDNSPPPPSFDSDCQFPAPAR